MRPLIIVGLATTAVVAIAGMGLLLLLLVAIVLSASSSPSYPTEFGSYPGDEGEYSTDYGGYDNVLYGNAQPLDRSPASTWLNGNEFSGRMSGGTIDTSGEGNHVIGLDGEVLNRP